MIIPIEELSTYESSRSGVGNREVKTVYKLHKPTGVYFSKTTARTTSKDKDVIRLNVAVITPEADEEQAKEWDFPLEKDFFEAVEYFEKLISERTKQQPEPTPNSSKLYYDPTFLKNAVVILEDQKTTIFIEKEDIKKALIFGDPIVLDMLSVEKEEYKLINSKFVLALLPIETKVYNEEFNRTDLEVYSMITVETNSNSSSTPSNDSGSESDKQESGAEQQSPEKDATEGEPENNGNAAGSFEEDESENDAQIVSKSNSNHPDENESLLIAEIEKEFGAPFTKIFPKYRNLDIALSSYSITELNRILPSIKNSSKQEILSKVYFAVKPYYE